MKKPLLFVLFLFLALAARAQVTLNTSVSATTFCADPGQPVAVNFSDAVGSYNGPNIFTAQLSDSQGSFAGPLTIGTLSSSASSGVIQAALPSTLQPGTGYRIRVVSTDPAVTGTDNGTDITINPLPVIAISPSVSSYCSGQALPLTATGALAYSWLPAPGLASPATGSIVTVSPTAPTTYTVVGTAANGCIGTGTAQVNASAYGVVFQESMGQVTVTTMVAAHEAANGFDNDQFTFSAIGTDIRNTLPSSGYVGASGGANVQINFNDVTNPSRQFRIDGINTFGMANLQLSFGIRKNTAASNGSELVVEASTDGGISWTLIPFMLLPTGGSSASVWHYVSTSGVIPQAQNLSIRFRQTASNVQFRIDDVELRNGGAPIPTITASGPVTATCPGTTVNLTASAGSSYLWSTGATTQVITVGTSGSYTVSVAGVSGCMATSDPVVVSLGPPIPVASNNGPVCEGQPLQLSVTGDPGLTYSWSGPNSWTSTFQNPSIPVTNAASGGIYSVFVTMPSCQPVMATTLAQVFSAFSQTAIFGDTALCQGQTLNLSVQPMAGATYTWSAGGVTIPSATGPFLSVPNITGSQAGIYSVVIQNTCGTATADVMVTVSAQPSAPAPTSNSPVCAGQDLFLFAFGVYPPGAVYSWTGPNGFTTNQQNTIIPGITQAGQGLYQIFVSLNGCTSAAGLTQVTVQNTPQIAIASNQPICSGQTLTMSATAIGGASYSWVGPNNFTASTAISTISNLQPQHYGTYTAYVTGSCPDTATHEVGAPMPPQAISNSPVCPGGTIQLSASLGNLTSASYSWVGPNGFTSAQQNPVIANATVAHAGTYTVYGVLSTCQTDPAFVQVAVNTSNAVTALSNSPVNQGSTLVLWAIGSVSSGSYSWTGPNNFSAVGSSPYLQVVTPANAGNYTVSFSMAGCPVASAVAAVTVTPMNQITGTVFYDLNNNGTQEAGEQGLGNKLIQVQAGYAVISNMLGQYTAYVPDGTYTLSPVNLQPAQTANPASRTVTVAGNQVSAGHNFGLYTPPVPNLNITATSIGVAAPGFVRTHVLTVTNLGNIPMAGTIRYKADGIFDFTPGTATSPGYSQAGDTLVWSFSNLLPNMILFRYAEFTVPVTTPLGTVLQSEAQATPVAGDIAPANNTYTQIQTVVGSWDPNDKAVTPEGPISPAQVAAAQPLEYQIRFQNTGTAPAVNVLVADTLSGHLDVTTFEMLGASHYYNVTMHENGRLEWHFPNIMLPDSNANEPLSHGYIQYSIKPKTTLQLGDEITNTAHIFFDFNEAVVTNTTSTIVALPSGIAEVQKADLLHIYPNPNNGQAMLKFTAANPAETTVSVLNLLGQEVLQLKKTTEAGVVEIPVDLQKQPAGIYLIKVQQNGKVYSAKMVRQ